MQRIFSLSFMVFAALSAYGQVTIMPFIENKEFQVNERMSLTFMLEISGTNLVQESRLQMPDLSKFEILGTASQQNTAVVVGPNGDLVNQLEYQFSLAPKQAGRIMIGSAIVKVSGKYYKTEPFYINVKEADKIVPKDNPVAVNTNTLSLNLQVEDPYVYQYEPTVAILRAYSKNIGLFRKVKNIQHHEVSSAEILPIPTADLNIEDHSNRGPSQILSFYLIIPKEEGYIDIPAITANMSGLHTRKLTEIHSNRVKIRVKKLPENAPANFKNAVGNYDVKIKADTTQDMEVDKPFNVAVTLSGKGNLSEVIIPKLSASDDYHFYKPKFENHIKVTEDGMFGDITAHYIIIPKRAGKINLQTENFSFFDPEKHSYEDAGSEELALNVLTHDDILNAKTPLERVNEYTNTVLETVNTPIIKTEALKVKEKSRLNWQAVATNVGILGLLFVCGLVYRRVKRNREKEKQREELRNKPLGSVAETESEIRERLKTDASDYFHFLEDLKNKEDFSQFFKTVDELDAEVRSQYFFNTESDFIAAITNFKGAKVANDYASLKQEIQICKYAPTKTTDDINILFEHIVKTYSEIQK